MKAADFEFTGYWGEGEPLVPTKGDLWGANVFRTICSERAVVEVEDGKLPVSSPPLNARGERSVTDLLTVAFSFCHAVVNGRKGCCRNMGGLSPPDMFVVQGEFCCRAYHYHYPLPICRIVHSFTQSSSFQRTCYRDSVNGPQ